MTIRQTHTFRQKRHAAARLALVFAWAAWAAQATAGGLPLRPPASEAPAAEARLWWHDGPQRRALQIVSSQVVDFRSGAAPSLRPYSRPPGRDAEKSAAELPVGVSPVFVEPGQPGRPRALPGGVIATLRQAPAGSDATARLAEARRQLAAMGLEAVSPIGADARRWLVASQPGLPALELANRLHASGSLESASPNWWQPRAKK